MPDKIEFKGFTKETFPFLKAIGFHQNREWFHENKKLYEQVIKAPMGDLVEAAANLFAVLHEADALAVSRGASIIRVAAVPEVGIGRAINDRLRQASIP